MYSSYPPHKQKDLMELQTGLHFLVTCPHPPKPECSIKRILKRQQQQQQQQQQQHQTELQLRTTTTTTTTTTKAEEEERDTCSSILIFFSYFLDLQLLLSMPPSGRLLS